jgi:uncharacterized repeat protein (TIGR01451 family)
MLMGISIPRGDSVTERTSLTLESVGSRWSSTDLNPAEPGVQVMVSGGNGIFELVPPANPGDGKVRVSAGTLQSEARIIFLPDLRPLTGIGVLEGVINMRNPGSMPMGAATAADAFESELRGLSDKNGDTQSTARTAFYFKGAVKGEYLLTAAYDSDKTTASTMFRDIQPDQFYPIYGDSSAKIFDAQSSQPLYVRIDKNRSYLLYGDYNTLLKEFRNVTACPADAASSISNTTAYDTRGRANPGQFLEYRLRYSNSTSAPLTNLKINDAVPSFTQFVGALCLVLPTTGISACTITQPAAGATDGGIVWTMADAANAPIGLQPLASGSVGFCVKVQQ